MRSKKMSAFALLSTLVLCSCASVPSVQPVAVSCPLPPPPPASLMQEPSSSMQVLDRIISPSGPVSITTAK